ncbi:MAG: hypothetical protein V4708_08300 [Bacteroidota bacterium]
MIRKTHVDSFKVVLLITLVVFITKHIQHLPWWFFLIPLLFVGILISHLEWEVPTFTIGFLSGFFIWLITNLYFELANQGKTLELMANFLSISRFLLLLLVGLVGGVTSGLALYTGKNIHQRFH